MLGGATTGFYLQGTYRSATQQNFVGVFVRNFG